MVVCYFRYKQVTGGNTVYDSKRHGWLVYVDPREGKGGGGYV